MNASSSSSQTQRQPKSKWLVWAQLVRLPNVFTILADITAAFLLTTSGPAPLSRLILVVLGGICLYWAGMTLNDVFDEAVDREQRAKRPIPAGLISKREASIGGWCLLLLGVLLATTSGFIPSDSMPNTWLPMIISIALAIMIVGYDGPLKSTVLAPAAMGSCRFLSFLLGASPAIALTSLSSLQNLGDIIPRETLAIASGFGIYIMGITTMARREATGGSTQHLIVGGTITTLGVICLAFAPQASAAAQSYFLDIRSVFPVLIGMIALPVLLRAGRAIRTPSPPFIQVTIKAGILTIIPLAAAFAALGAGPLWGGVIFCLVIPSFLLAGRFRVT